MKNAHQSDLPINRSQIIDSLPLFSGLSFFEKRLIASKSRVVEYEKGHDIYQEGDAPDYFYCMVNGRAEMYHPPSKTKRRGRLSIECVRRGDYFGSISSLTGHPHSVSAKAINDSAVLIIKQKEFDYILKKVPKLAVFLSRSLSRRLSKKPVKRVFESTIVSVYGVEEGAGSSRYAQALAESIRNESGKKVLLIRSASIPNKKDVSRKLSAFAEDHHFVIVDVPEGLSGLNLEVLKQSDRCHIICPSDRMSLCRAESLIKQLRRALGRGGALEVSVMIKEDPFYPKSSYEERSNILSREVSASLPSDRQGYERALRRTARELSGVMTGLVLGSGAAMGLAHIGVLKVLEDEKIPIDVISATSIGALIAALWAAGLSARKIERFMSSFKSRLKVLSLIDPTFPVRGLIKGNTVRNILKRYLGNKKFSDARFPLKIVACDIKKRREVIIEKGRLVDAVMASIAIPGVFEPVVLKNNVHLVDGGIVNPLPVSCLSRAGLKRIIAVNTLPSPDDMVRIERNKLNIYDIIVNSFQTMEYSLSEYSCQQADVYLHPIPLADWYEFYKAKSFIRAGTDCARRMLPKIKNLVKS
ncbi:patatin-like phospholipase family protein [Candidatus Omnitrophota bacterium]